MAESRISILFTSGAAVPIHHFAYRSAPHVYYLSSPLCCSDYTKGVIYRNSSLSSFVSDANTTLFTVHALTLFFRVLIFTQN